MAVSKYSDISSFVASIYERSLFVARENNLMTQLVRNFSASGWQPRVLSIRPQATAATVADGADFAGTATWNKSSKATLTPSEVIAQYILTDQQVDTDPDGAMTDASLELGNAIATKIDTDLVGDFTSFTTDKGPGAGSAVTIAKLASAVSVLRNNKAPAPIYAVLHPYHWHDVWVLLGQPAATYSNLGEATNAALRDFYVNSMLGIQFFTNANIAVDASDDAVSGIFNSQAIGFDTRRAPRMEEERDASLRATELNITAGYAHGVIRTEFGVKFTADATEPS